MEVVSVGAVDVEQEDVVNAGIGGLSDNKIGVVDGLVDDGLCVVDAAVASVVDVDSFGVRAEAVELVLDFFGDGLKLDMAESDSSSDSHSDSESLIRFVFVSESSLLRRL